MEDYFVLITNGCYKGKVGKVMTVNNYVHLYKISNNEYTGIVIRIANTIRITKDSHPEYFI